VMGKEAIKAAVAGTTSADFFGGPNVELKIASTDAQAGPEGSVVLLVTGVASVDGGLPPRAFVNNLFLAPQGGDSKSASYFVLNDTFRLLDPASKPASVSARPEGICFAPGLLFPFEYGSNIARRHASWLALKDSPLCIVAHCYPSSARVCRAPRARQRPSPSPRPPPSQPLPPWLPPPRLPPPPPRLLLRRRPPRPPQLLPPRRLSPPLPLRPPRQPRRSRSI